MINVIQTADNPTIPQQNTSGELIPSYAHGHPLNARSSPHILDEQLIGEIVYPIPCEVSRTDSFFNILESIL